MQLKNEMELFEQSDMPFVEEIKKIVGSARQKAYSAINFAQVEANWLVGKRIVQQEQAGKERAEYGKYIIRIVSQALTQEFKSGFSVTNITIQRPISKTTQL
jgi:hypothetical protein